MKKLLAFALALSFTPAIFAQEYKPPTKAQIRIHQYRLAMNEPPYGLAKVKRAIKHIKISDEGNQAMPQKQFEAMPFNEKLTYVMIHGEQYNQNCEMPPTFKDEDKKIFAFMPGGFGDDTSWSQRQKDFARKYRPKFIELIRNYVRTSSHVGLNVKYAAHELAAYELVPDFIAAFKRNRRDNDILSLLMNFIIDGNYSKFNSTPIYKKLYSDNYWAWIVATRANQDFILEQATAFSKWKK